ncbi:MAG: sigma 54-interacting transcriptional regulator [Ahrensia sp.]|nr:sigma 54-interacting transcriptional regulator [Ahrensia sp.]
MPLSLQSKILRLVEDRSFYRVGGETPLAFQGRIVAATHRDLQKAIAEKQFREDLFYRLAVLPISIAPLRERPQDIIRFMQTFLKQACERQKRPIEGFSIFVEELALEHRWRGNIRELLNRIERAVAVSKGPLIQPSDMFPENVSADAGNGSFVQLADIRDDAERRHIERALSKTGGQIAESAKLLGVSRTTLWEKMSKLGIELKRSEN